MDLKAYVISTDELISSYVEKHYGDVPRLRGISLMKFERPGYAGNGPEGEVWNRHCGEDVVYIHTRCGSCHTGDEGNYSYFGADKWEESNSDTFIESVDEDFDSTYRSHYFKAVQGDDYEKICQQYEAIFALDGEEQS